LVKKINGRLIQESNFLARGTLLKEGCRFRNVAPNVWIPKGKGMVPDQLCVRLLKNLKCVYARYPLYYIWSSELSE